MEYQEYSRLQNRIAGLETMVEAMGRELALVKALLTTRREEGHAQTPAPVYGTGEEIPGTP